MIAVEYRKGTSLESMTHVAFECITEENQRLAMKVALSSHVTRNTVADKINPRQHNL